MSYPAHISTERTYEGRIDGTYQTPAGGGPPVSVVGGITGDDNSFFYTFHIVDSQDTFEQTSPTSPFRRLIKSDLGDRPQVVSAKANDPCRVDFSGGVVRLIDVLEQYIVGACAPPVVTPASLLAQQP